MKEKLFYIEYMKAQFELYCTECNAQKHTRSHISMQPLEVTHVLTKIALRENSTFVLQNKKVLKKLYKYKVICINSFILVYLFGFSAIILIKCYNFFINFNVSEMLSKQSSHQVLGHTRCISSHGASLIINFTDSLSFAL